MARKSPNLGRKLPDLRRITPIFCPAKAARAGLALLLLRVELNPKISSLLLDISGGLGGSARTRLARFPDAAVAA